MLHIIQSLWIGPALSKMEQLCILSFMRNGHAFHLYTYEAVSGIPEGTVIKDASEIIERDAIFTYQKGLERGSFAGFSNYFRYKLLYLRGGIWVDMDMVCLKPFDFNETYLFSSQLDADGRKEMTNCVLSGVAGSDIYKDAFTICVSKPKESIVFGETGPVLIRSLAKKYNLENFSLPFTAFCPVHYNQFKTLLESKPDIDEFMMELHAKSYGIHLWNELWRRFNIDKNGENPKTSVYQYLLDKYKL